MQKVSRSLLVIVAIFCLALGICSQSYASGCSYYLPVPFLKQVPPGDWTNTKNCGQTCAVMLGGYFNKTAVTSTQITAQNTWLANYTHDTRYNNANGWYTGGSSIGAYRTLLSQVHHLNSFVYNGSSFDDILNYGCDGFPVIAGVMISGGNLVSSGGLAHWVIVVGYDGCNVIINDPGSSSGNARRYSLATFVASWSTQAKIYMPISN